MIIDCHAHVSRKDWSSPKFLEEVIEPAMRASGGSIPATVYEGTDVPALMETYRAAGVDRVLFYAVAPREPRMYGRDPKTREIWASNNGRDWLGDDLPPETINVVKEGLDFGWPRCHAGDLVDPEFGKPRGCEGVAPPAITLQAHSAPLGLAFYSGDRFPAEYRGNLFVAYHGSWNRSVPTGYKVVRVPFKDGRPVGGYANFMVGFWTSGRSPAEVWGRPAALAVTKDGALLVADDTGGTIWRVGYAGTPRQTGTPGDTTGTMRR